MAVTHKSSVWSDSHIVTGALGALDTLTDSSGYLYNDGSGNLAWATVSGSSGAVTWASITGIPANVSSFGSLADSAGYLYNNGAGVLSYATPGGAGTVTTVSVVTANGLAGTVANATTTPAITLTTSITGMLKGNGTAISAASAGTDYQAPLGAGSIVGGSAYSNVIIPSNAAPTLVGTGNVAIGYGVWANKYTDTNSVVIGYNAAAGYGTATGNVLIGATVAPNLTDGGGNVFVGNGTGAGVTTGTGNTILGSGVVGLGSGLTGNIILAAGGVTKMQWNGTVWSFSGSLSGSGANLTAIPWSAMPFTPQVAYTNLTTIGSLANAAGLLRNNGAGVFSYDTSTFLTGNQSITLSGDASGTGATAITVSIASFSGSTKGLVPASAGGTTNFLRADGSWASPGGGPGATDYGTICAFNAGLATQ